MSETAAHVQLLLNNRSWRAEKLKRKLGPLNSSLFSVQESVLLIPLMQDACLTEKELEALEIISQRLK